MKLIHAQDIRNGVAERVRQRYAYDLSFSPPRGLTTARYVFETLSKIENPTADQIKEAMQGWPEWASNDCDECGNHSEVLVRFGDDPDHGLQFQDLCPDCLKDGLRIAGIRI